MSALKVNAGVCVMFAALVMLAASSQSARADTIFLTCNEGIIGPKTFTVDLTNNTVNNEPATINSTAIDWQIQLHGDATGQVTSGRVYNHIDRTAGTIREYVTYHWANGRDITSDPNTYPCSVGSPPPTKF